MFKTTTIGAFALSTIALSFCPAAARKPAAPSSEAQIRRTAVEPAATGERRCYPTKGRAAFRRRRPPSTAAGSSERKHRARQLALPRSNVRRAAAQPVGHRSPRTTSTRLGLAWSWDTGTRRGLEATPIVVDGVMFSTGSWSVVWAHDAATGELLWRYDPMVPREWGKYACCDVVNRGVAAWKGRIYSGTLDGRLIALEAGTGELAWEVRTTDPERPYTITGAPAHRQRPGGHRQRRRRVRRARLHHGLRHRGRVLSAGAFTRCPAIPADGFENRAMEVAAGTWRGGKWWEVGGGGTVWDSMAYDPALNLLYVGVGNGAPVEPLHPLTRRRRQSLCVVDPGDQSGQRLAGLALPDHPGRHLGLHGGTQHMILADIEIEGRDAQGADAGAEERLLLRARPGHRRVHLGRGLRAGDLGDPHRPGIRTPGGEPGRPLRQRGARDPTGALRRPQLAPDDVPSRAPGLVYIPALDLSFSYAQDNAFKYNPEGWNTGVDFKEIIPCENAG